MYHCPTCRADYRDEDEYKRCHTCPGRKESERPPIGIMPRYLWEEQRFQQLHAAIKRYAEDNMKINPEWIEEYNELHSKIESRWLSGGNH